MDRLRVLVWGTDAAGACAFFRGHLFDEPLAALGVEMRHVSALNNERSLILDRDGYAIDTNKIPPSELLAMLDRGDARLDYKLDTSSLQWADVLLFRRYYRVTGRDLITRALWDVAESLTDAPAIVYDTDDLLLGPAPRWNGLWADMEAAEPMVRRMARRADLVTVSTPTLARHFGRLNPNLRVIRNAIDPELYVPTEPRPEGERTRVLLYGNVVRLRDFLGYPSQAVADYRHRVRVCYLGAERNEVGGLFDEAHGYVTGLPEFCRALGNLHPDVGLAPIADATPFDRSKSELHWLEYSAAGAATIATRMNGDGPYDVIRDGIDGILARGRAEWSDGLKLLLDPSRRADIASAARERVMRDYSHVKRAEEWASALRWAAEHRGIGLKAA
ncbi:MAG: glycosyltransferase [Candidatus Limnocylindrales bacterium]|jgi:glycosyltransferase involved in cell wall biosynthesis